MYKKKFVFMEHDGAVDDFLSQMLLLTMEKVEILGINVTAADCFIEPAIETTYKILSLFKKAHIPIGRSDLSGINAFPNEWRARPEVINALPNFINIPYDIDPYSLPTAFDLLQNTLQNAIEPISIIITGPCSNLTEVLKNKPELKNKISEVIWMAGAFNTGGNVENYQHDGSAEWNVYWDPVSAKELFEMELPLVCIPLDVTNNVPVEKSFLSKLAEKSKDNLSNIACQLWALTVDTIPSYYYTYFMWDVLATSYLSLSDFFEIEEVSAVVKTNPPNAGQTIITENGNDVKIATAVKKDVFYNYILSQFDRILV